MTTPYNPCWNSICERFNLTLLGLLQSLPKEKSCWPFPSLVFTYNATSHSITGYQPYELLFGCKAPTFCDACLKLAHYNDQDSTNKCAWLNEQHELLMGANRWALKHIRQNAKKSQVRTCGKTLHIPIGNLILLWDHPEGCNKIQDNYKSEWCVVVDHHKDPNVYIIQSLDKKVSKRTVNWQQLFDLIKLQVDPFPSDPSIKGPKFDHKLIKIQNPKFVILIILGQRPRPPQYLFSQLTFKMNKGGIWVYASGLEIFLAPSRMLLFDN